MILYDTYNFHPTYFMIPLKPIIGFLNGYGLIKQGFKSRFGWRPWEPS